MRTLQNLWFAIKIGMQATDVTSTFWTVKGTVKGLCNNRSSSSSITINQMVPLVVVWPARWQAVPSTLGLAQDHGARLVFSGRLNSYPMNLYMAGLRHVTTNTFAMHYKCSSVYSTYRIRMLRLSNGPVSFRF